MEFVIESAMEFQFKYQRKTIEIVLIFLSLTHAYALNEIKIFESLSFDVRHKVELLVKCN